MSAPTPPPAPTPAPAAPGPLRVAFKAFDSKMASRDKLFRAATEFATQIGRDNLITLTHSEDRDNIVISIWYWTTEVEVKFEMRNKAPAVQKSAATMHYVGSGEGRPPPKEEPVRQTLPGTMVPGLKKEIQSESAGKGDEPEPEGPT